MLAGILSLFHRKKILKLLPNLRIDGADRVPSPFLLRRACEENARKNESAAALRMPLAVSKRECGSPRSPENHPLLDAEAGSQRLDILHEVPRRIVLERTEGRGCTTSPLIEKHRTKLRPINQP